MCQPAPRDRSSLLKSWVVVTQEIVAQHYAGIATKARGWEWDADSQRWRWPNTGRAVPPSRIRQVFQRRQDDARERMRDIGRRWAEGEISEAQFILDMRREIKRGHIQGMLLSVGGRENATQADYGRAGQRLRQEYQFLREFAAEARDRSPAYVANRAGYYAGSNMGNAMVDAGLASAKRAGMTQKRRVGPNDQHTCPTCRREIAAGWVDIDRAGWLLGHRGDTECQANDRCLIEYGG